MVHGGGLDAAMARFGGARSDWLDLSTGINPVSYPLPALDTEVWTRLPDSAAQERLLRAARAAWTAPAGAALLPAPGTSALIARLPALDDPGTVWIPGPTYSEHARSFRAAGWTVAEGDTCPANATAAVLVSPDNPTGRIWAADDLPDLPLRILDLSFADLEATPALMAEAARPGTIILRGLGKFWGLAGLRLGAAVGDPDLLDRLGQMLGPWPVSGPALAVGTAALEDHDWITATRARLAADSARMVALLARHGLNRIGGTALFHLCEHAESKQLFTRLARQHILTRPFAHTPTWLRIGLPGPEADWARFDAALSTMEPPHDPC
ncbi:threonine-phosphate decarboxylase CobD [Oceanomicrobium pacificus]|uniref:threonine-phosphate decarboxylase n=1 Tax=Oceanomicrobium pacificus TaxID=2692916 RepID=A0A6B0TQI0_9RHOB|nr:threonine-phosphate decarboxylase CobD [Oceanomicrobium pacificus]MXU64045.1 threonine-phosphate decarboxylase [Oceanomicrobium pacificus]